MLLPYLLDLSVTFAFLAWGSASDVRRRAVNSFLFLPVAIAGLAYGAYVHEPLFFLVLSGISFILAFVRTDILLYPALAASMLGVSTYFVTIEPTYGLQLLLISIVLLAGYREVVFGIGDIKAMVSAMISLSALLPLTPVMVQEGQLLSIVPSAIMLVINAGLSSILFFPYLAIRNAVRGGQFDFAWFLTVPDGEDPRKFSERDLSGRRLRIYKVPFIVPILIGSIATALFGAWPVLLVR